MEQFSRAYVHAVASAAACSASKPEVDIDSVDVSLRRKTIGTPRRSPQLDVQLKATYTDCVGDTSISYPLGIKNYDELRDLDFTVPRILVVVVIPPDMGDWIEHGENQLALKKCGYWISLRGEPALKNTTTVTVSIPRSQVFDVQGLHQLFVRLADGGSP